MPNTTRGVGLFTAENIVAVLRAIPESDGTYRDVARKAEQYGGNVQYHTISNWASYGRTDVEAGQPSTAYARFTKLYKDLVVRNLCNNGLIGTGPFPGHTGLYGDYRRAIWHSTPIISRMLVY